ncbi:MAG: aminotransferase class V-fold PLP-dependent enzyme [Spirosomaceae bacterium]|nr:aminotransferase class V-fold PLP-dependent enzyme [Spirosomataceae bacterium]
MLTCQKHLFSIEPGVHYLNNAAYGPLPNVTAAAAQIGIDKKVNPNLKKSSDHYETAERVRALVAEMIHAEHPHRIAIIPSVSYGLGVVAANLHRVKDIKNKTNFVLIESGFPNDSYAFERVCKQLNLHEIICEKPISNSVGKDWNEAVLNAISDKTAMVVLPHVHWIYGTIFDLEKIGKKCRQYGVLLIIDGTQSIGAMPFDNSKIQADAVICAAYKWLLSPYSIGFGYFGDFFDDGVPLEESWMNRTNSEDFGNLTTLVATYRPMAQRYNMGEFSQFIQLPMLEESLKLLLNLGVENIQEYAKGLTQKPLAELKQLGCIFESDEFRAGHLIGIELPTKVNINDLFTKLLEHQVFVSRRGNGFRISVNVFNDEADIAAFVDIIKAC